MTDRNNSVPDEFSQARTLREKLIKGKDEMRKRLASLSFSEKIKILERLRDREKAIATAGLRRTGRKVMPDLQLESSCRTVRDRSSANRAALDLLDSAGLTGKVVGTLREELDSMIRCIYLLSLKDRQRRAQLISQFLAAHRWPVTDARMIAGNLECYVQSLENDSELDV